MSDRFEDHRGVIQDLFDGQPIGSVTDITTFKGAVRGNHYHRHTTQWTLVLAGSLLVSNGQTETVVGPREFITHEPGEPHAWKALEDTDCLVFTRGPRAGAQYESDTVRLAKPLLS